MTRRSRREIARTVEDLNTNSAAGGTPADDWRAFLKGELSFSEYKARRGGNQ